MTISLITGPVRGDDVNRLIVAVNALVIAAEGEVVQDQIVNGVTTIAPSQNAVFDALALKQDASGTAAAAKAAAVADAIVNGVTDVAPSQNAVYDALALKQAADDQLTSIAGLAYATNSLKVVRVNAGETAFELATVSGGATALDGLSDCITDYGTSSMYLGDHAGFNISGAGSNTSLGDHSLFSCIDGAHSVAVGTGALETVVHGSANTAIGDQALNVYLGSSSTGIGQGALSSSTAGDDNIAVGQGAGASLLTGASNTALGTNTAGTLTTGSGNTLVGNAADVSIAAGANQIAIGDGAVCAGNNQIQIGNTSSTIATIGGADGAIQTGDTNLATGTFAPWQLGDVVVAGSTPDATKYLEIAIGGVPYKLVIAV